LISQTLVEEIHRGTETRDRREKSRKRDSHRHIQRYTYRDQERKIETQRDRQTEGWRETERDPQRERFNVPEQGPTHEEEAWRRRPICFTCCCYCRWFSGTAAEWIVREGERR
jgi:hypothetical protein